MAERTGQTMLIKSFGTEEKEEKAVGSRMRGYYRAYIRNSWVTNLLSPTYAVAGAMQFIILVLVGRRFYGDGSLSLAQWVAYFAFANQIINSLTAYGGYWTTFRATQGSAFRITRVMNETEEDLSTGDPVECLSGDIVFHDLVFGFGEEPLFDHLNLTIPAGKATAVIGPSGSGKTTLLNLLDRLYEPEGGGSPSETRRSAVFPEKPIGRPSPALPRRLPCVPAPSGTIWYSGGRRLFRTNRWKRHH
ncbi:MAG: ABC transporter ATP-binding protein [Lachnospiraceae bacterium]|nr:ABC transporter ATP-binding protein [Lachnospiraceae bacterium]